MEAISYVVPLLAGGLLRSQDLWLKQSGDVIMPFFRDNLDPGTKHLLQVHMLDSHAALATEPGSADRERSAVVLCHSTPDCWATGEPPQAFKGMYGCPCPDDSHPVSRWTNPSMTCVPALRAVTFLPA